MASPSSARLDEVNNAGSFIELEISADDSTLENAKSGLANLAEHLGLQRSERRSYLELVLLSEKKYRP